MNKFILLLACSAIIFCLSCTKEVVDAKKEERKNLISHVKSKQQQDWDNSKNEILLKAKKVFGYNKTILADECQCFYEIVKSTGGHSSFPDVSFEISSNSFCGTQFPPTCRYIQALQTTVPQGSEDCFEEIVQGCTDFYYNGLGSENWANFNCNIDEGEVFRVTAFGTAFNNLCLGDFLESAKISIRIGCVSSNNSECPSNNFINYSPVFTLTPDYVTGSPDGLAGFDFQDIFSDCGCIPKIIN